MSALRAAARRLAFGLLFACLFVVWSGVTLLGATLWFQAHERIGEGRIGDGSFAIVIGALLMALSALGVIAVLEEEK